MARQQDTRYNDHKENRRKKRKKIFKLVFFIASVLFFFYNPWFNAGDAAGLTVLKIAEYQISLKENVSMEEVSSIVGEENEKRIKEIFAKNFTMENNLAFLKDCKEHGSEKALDNYVESFDVEDVEFIKAFLQEFLKEKLEIDEKIE